MVCPLFSVAFSILTVVVSLKSQTVTGQAVAGLTDNFLLVTDSSRNNVFEIGLDNGQIYSLYSSRARGTNPVAVTYDPINKIIYFSDNGDYIKSITKFSMITLTSSTIYVDSTLTAVFDGLTIDPYEQIIYYADAGFGEVGQMSTSGTGKRVISAIANSQPRAIVHDKQNSLLYWTDWSSVFPTIYRAPIRTGTTTALVSGNLLWPNALAIDFFNGVMYWGDAGLHKIEMANLDGTGRTLLVQSTTAHYYGMALDSTYLYYTDWTLSYVIKMNRQSYILSNVSSTAAFGRLNGIFLYNSTDRNTIGNVNLTSTARSVVPTSSATTTTTTTTTNSMTTTTTTTPAVIPERSSITTAYAANTNSYPETTSIRTMTQSSTALSTTSVVIIAAVVSCAGVIIVVAVVVGCVIICKRRQKNSETPVPKNQQVVYTVPPMEPPSYEFTTSNLPNTRPATMNPYTQIEGGSGIYETMRYSADVENEQYLTVQ